MRLGNSGGTPYDVLECARRERTASGAGLVSHSVMKMLDAFIVEPTGSITPIFAVRWVALERGVRIVVTPTEIADVVALLREAPCVSS